jgi:hypothetical protein
MGKFVRTIINVLVDGQAVTLVPLTDGVSPPVFNETTPPDTIKKTIDDLIKSTNYATLDRVTFNILMNMGLSPHWYKETRTGKPLVWISEPRNKPYFVARLVANTARDEIIEYNNRNNCDLRNHNLHKIKTVVDGTDRDDIVNFGVAPVIKFLNLYQDYSMPTFVYN